MLDPLIGFGMELIGDNDSREHDNRRSIEQSAPFALRVVHTLRERRPDGEVEMTRIQHQLDDADEVYRHPWSHKRPQAVALVLTALLLLTGLFSVAGWMAPGGAAVARAADTSGDQKVAVFEDAVVGPGEAWDNVVVVGGDLLIQGTVYNVVVVVFGDITVADGARVGSGVNPDDAAIVSVFGQVTVQSGAEVRGRTVDVAGGIAGLDMSVGDPVLRPWRTGAILNWIWSTIFLAVVAVIITAIAPRQVAAVRDRVRKHFFSSLGWGALGAIIAVPIITVALIISVIGIILVVPWLAIVLPIMSLFGLVAVGAMVGRLILGARQDKRETVMLAAVLGVVIINIARWIPVGWIVILGVLWLVGFGATYVAIWAWLRDRRRKKREAAAEEQAAWAAATSPGGMPYAGGPPVPPPGPATGPPPSAPVGSQPVSAPQETAPPTPGPTSPGADAVADAPAATESEGTVVDAPAAPGPEVAADPPSSGHSEPDELSSS